MRAALEKVSCVVDTALERRMEKPDDARVEPANNNILADDNYEYDYKEDYTERLKQKPSKAKKLTDIPLELLPCPKELMETIEESYGHPVQNEIRLKAYSKATLISPSLALVLMLSLLF